MHGHIGARTHGDADIGLAKRGRVVHAIAGHRETMHPAFKCLECGGICLLACTSALTSVKPSSRATASRCLALSPVNTTTMNAHDRAGSRLRRGSSLIGSAIPSRPARRFCPPREILQFAPVPDVVRLARRSASRSDARLLKDFSFPQRHVLPSHRALHTFAGSGIKLLDGFSKTFFSRLMTIARGQRMLAVFFERGRDGAAGRLQFQPRQRRVGHAGLPSVSVPVLSMTRCIDLLHEFRALRRS